MNPEQIVHVSSTACLASITDLHELPNWIVFELERLPNGKIKKTPFVSGTSNHASSTNPATGCSYAAAVADDRDIWHEPGLAIPTTTTLIDIDGCITPDGTISAGAQRLIETLDSYTERSISGTGIHILVIGHPPENATKPSEVEVYRGDRGRFVLLSEEIIDGRDTIEDRAEILAQLFPPAVPSAALPSIPLTMDDAAIVAKCRSSRSGAKFDRLWSGDDSEHDHDRSRGDQAFTSLLAFYTQDEQQLLRIVHQSGRWREKWERRDYQQRTIAKALQRSDFYTPPTDVAPRGYSMEPIGQDVPSAENSCASERETIAELRNVIAAQAAELAELRPLRAENAAHKEERDHLSLLQSATMTLLRSREFHAGQKIVGLVSLFEAEAARSRGTTDHDGWLDTPLERIAEAAGCSAKAAGKHQVTIATSGILETQTINRHDPVTGAIKKHRQIRLSPPGPDTPAPSLPERILALSTAAPERDPKNQRWGGKRICPDCGDAGAVIITTISCKGCGQVLSSRMTEQAPESDPPTPPPMGHLVLSKNRGCLHPVIGQDGPSADEALPAEPTYLADAPPPDPIAFTSERQGRRPDRAQRRDLAARDLEERVERHRAPGEDEPRGAAPEPLPMFPLDEPPRGSHHVAD